MVFISYAQNSEDVMLQRALKDVEQGRYIDVGAADPEVHSVTAAFYGRGWNGLNIEPNGEFFQKLRDRRPRDVNLPIALGGSEGRATFYRIPGTGLSTCNESVAARQREAGWRIVEETVPVRTLADVCREHMPGTVHFLKIDVEGAERAVLSGADFGAHRPWIVLVEATEPSGTRNTEGEWAHLLTGRSYKEVYFDGLNRFYVAEERLADLAHAFAVPPNVHDNFVRASDEASRLMLEAQDRTAAATERAGRAEAGAAAAAEAAAAADGRARQADERARQTDERLRQADERARQADERAESAEVRARDADGRCQQAERRAQQETARRAVSEAAAQAASREAAQAETARAAAVEALAACRAENRAQAERAAVAETAAAAAAQALNRLQAEQAAANALVLALRTSASWELTGPFRLFGLMARRYGRLSAERRARSTAPAPAGRAALAPAQEAPSAPAPLSSPPRLRAVAALRDRRGQAIFERLHKTLRKG